MGGYDGSVHVFLFVRKRTSGINVRYFVFFLYIFLVLGRAYDETNMCVGASRAQARMNAVWACFSRCESDTPTAVRVDVSTFFEKHQHDQHVCQQEEESPAPTEESSAHTAQTSALEDDQDNDGGRGDDDEGDESFLDRRRISADAGSFNSLEETNSETSPAVKRVRAFPPLS